MQHLLDRLSPASPAPELAGWTLVAVLVLGIVGLVIGIVATIALIAISPAAHGASVVVMPRPARMRGRCAPIAVENTEAPENKPAS